MYGQGFESWFRQFHCKLKTAMPENVVYAGGYIRFIKSKKQLILSDHEVSAICNNIKAGHLKPSLRTHIDHVKHVKTLVAAKQTQDESTCLKCGKPMVIRTVRSGVNQRKKFFGCKVTRRVGQLKKYRKDN